MSVKPYRATRTARTRSRKFSGRCEACGKPLCSCRAYQYTDESNGAITASAPFLCRDCYEQKYGVRIPTEVDAYKDNQHAVPIRQQKRNNLHVAFSFQPMTEQADSGTQPSPSMCTPHLRPG